MSADPPRKAPSREALLAVHQFPGEYVLKAFGPGHDDFHSAVVAAAHRELHPERVVATTRITSSGGRQCVTLMLLADTVEEIEALYERLHELETLQFIL